MSLDVANLKEYSLSNEDIDRLLGGTNIYAYPELARFQKLSDALDSRGRVVILYLTEDDSTGHWVCVWKDGKTVQYFDPYGEPPEQPKTWLTPSHNAELGQSQDHMLRLMRAEDMPVFYSTHPYQKDGADINTCGRHTISRLLMKDLDARQYYELVKDSDVKPDDFVALATYFLLGR